MYAIRWLLLVLFIGYYGSITLFLHTHHLKNGIITHSHPFSNAKHEHSTTDYLIIDALSQLITDGSIGGISLIVLVLLIAELLLERTIGVEKKRLKLYNYHRGPPILASHSSYLYF